MWILGLKELSGYQVLDTLSLALFQGHDEGKYNARKKVTTDFERVILLLSSVCFKIK